MWRGKPYSWELRLFALFLVGWMRLEVVWVSYFLVISPSTLRRWMKEEAALMKNPVVLYRKFRETISPRGYPAVTSQRLASVIPLFPPLDPP